MEMAGKTVLFTGASRGMGRLAAMELARRGAEVLVVGHNEARGAQALAMLRQVGQAEFFLADMGEADDVRRLADRVLARSGGLQVLVHSAFGLPPTGERTREGVDRGYAQNFLGAYLLTALLEERLLASAPARVIAVSSGAHRRVKALDLDALMRPGKKLSQMDSYAMAKLAMATWSYGLARRWAGRGVTANVLDPGWVRTEMGDQFQGPALMRWLIVAINRLFAVSMEKGSRQYVKLATDPALGDVSGRYFVSGDEKLSSPLTYNESLRSRIDEAAAEWARPHLC